MFFYSAPAAILRQSVNFCHNIQGSSMVSITTDHHNYTEQGQLDNGCN